MTKLKKRTRALPLALACLFAAGVGGAYAQRRLAGRPEVKVQLAGTIKRGDEAVPLEKVEAVRPGEVLDWTITSINEGDGAARQYRTVGHVPAGTSFVAGSATAAYEAQISYSVDGGKSFSAQPEVEERQPDGTLRRVPAPASAYTQVRYEWADALAAGATLTASYKVRVK